MINCVAANKAAANVNFMIFPLFDYRRAAQIAARHFVGGGKLPSIVTASGIN